MSIVNNTFDHSVSFRYHSLALEEKVGGWRCWDGHGLLYPIFDWEAGELVWMCPGCDYKMFPGITMYESMIDEMSLV